MTLRQTILAATAICALPLAAQMGDYVTYDVGGMAFEGYVATPTGESRGTVLIVHDWDGMTAYEEGRADMLAEAGYTAFAIDVYGAETDPQGFEEYRALSGALYGDRETFRERLLGSIMAAVEIPGATGNMVMIGYCFGGAAVLEAARAGADLDGFVSFHGGLPTPEGQDWSHGQRRAEDVLPRLGRPGLGHRRPRAGDGGAERGRHPARSEDLRRRAAQFHGAGIERLPRRCRCRQLGGTAGVSRRDAVTGRGAFSFPAIRDWMAGTKKRGMA
jgi:dienelactone hydrolase